MKKAIELLEEALKEADHKQKYSPNPRMWDRTIQLIKETITELTPPRFETPEQWEQRTGEKWPDDWAVYLRRRGIYEWEADSYYFAKKAAIYEGRSIVCATEAGCPLDGWWPKETK